MITSPTHHARKAAVIGASTIGLAWAGLFAANGWHVQVFDPRDDLPRALEQTAASAARVLGGEAADLLGRIHVAETFEAALEDATIVQEAGPERLEWKRDLFRRAEAATPATTVLATSSSSIPASAICEGNLSEGRMLVGHPYNPVLVLPLIEVVPGPDTREDVVNTAQEIYRGLGKEPVVLKREVPGFVGNRLQWALLKEAMSLVADGIVEPAQLDRIIKTSLGPRWAAWGPLEATRLGGGEHGAAGILENVGSQMFRVDMGEPTMEQLRAVARTIDAPGATDRLTPADAAHRLAAVLRAGTQH